MSWAKMKIGELCLIEKGKIGIQKATPGEYPLVVTAEERLSHNEYHFDRNAVVIPLVSSTGHGHRSLKRIHFQSGKFAVGNILCAVIPHDENVLRADYLYRFLDLNREKELVGRMRGMANVTLPIKEIAQIEIPVPPIEAQINFVEQYSILEEKSNELDQELTHQLDLVKQLRQAFLRKAMRGELMVNDELSMVNEGETGAELLYTIKAEKENLIKENKIKKQKPLPPITKEEIPFEIPENWVWCRLGDLAASATNGLYKPANYYKPKGVISLRMYNIQDGKVQFNKIKRVVLNQNELETYRLQENDLLVNRVNSRELVGKTALIPQYNEPLVYESMNIRLCLILKDRLSLFINLNLMEQRVRDYFYSTCKIANGQVSINQAQLFETLIPLPPLSEQQRIVAKLDELMQYCDELETSINESKQQNGLLLQQVLREALEPEEKEVVG